MRETILPIACPACDTILSDLVYEDMNYHLAKCQGEWVEYKPKRWGVKNALPKPDYQYCRGCANWHTGPKNANCKQPFEESRAYT